MENRVNHALGALLSSISPAGRRELSHELAVALRQSQKSRIERQENPDGTAFAVRKPRWKNDPRQKKAMFRKLKNARFMRFRASARESSVMIGGASSNYIAMVHQYGFKSKVGKTKTGVPVYYKFPQRRLLGFSDADMSLIETLTIKHLAEAVDV